MVRNEKVGERESIDTVPLASGRFKGRWRLFSVETRLAASQAAALPENSLN
jgi:hypothetical protein